jgi:hypothetical protein
MKYTKQYLNKNLKLNDQNFDKKIFEEKESCLVDYSKKINQLNSILQQYKLELYELKNKEQCKNKSKNLINDVETSFLSLFSLLKNEMRDSKFDVNLIVINLNDRENKKSKLID